MKKFIFILAFIFTILASAQKSTLKFTIKNLELNTSYSDFGAIFYQDNKIVFASPNETHKIVRKTCEVNNQPYLDLYIGTINEDGEISNKKKMLGKQTTKFHEAMLCFTKDGKTVYFSANDNYKNLYKKRKNRSNYIQLFKAEISEDGEWKNIKKLPFNSKYFSTGHPALSFNEKRLYFVSDRPESIGKTDIYYVDILDNHYGEPINLGPKVNTIDKEMFPFICKKGVLWFSSLGHGGYGGLDVYASKINSNDFSSPINLQKPINSAKDDFAFIIDEKGKGYFSSNRKGGKGHDDLYSFISNTEYLAALFNIEEYKVTSYSQNTN